jgi:hypothetical protein
VHTALRVNQRLIGRSPSGLTPLEKSSCESYVESALRVLRSPIGWIFANGETPSMMSLFGYPTKLAGFSTPCYAACGGSTLAEDRPCERRFR